MNIALISQTRYNARACPEDRAILERNLSAETGDRRKGRGRVSDLAPLYDNSNCGVHKAINSPLLLLFVLLLPWIGVLTQGINAQKCLNPRTENSISR